MITVIGYDLHIVLGKGCSQELVGIDLDEEAERNRLVDAITDLLLNGLRPDEWESRTSLPQGLLRS